jgi:hypothetical protein
VYSLIVPHPHRGKRYDAQPEDEGSEPNDGSSEEDNEDDDDDDDDNGDKKPKVDEQQVKASTVVDVKTTTPSTLTEPCQNVLTEHTESALLLNDLRTKLESMAVVLKQVQALEDVALEAHIKKAIANLEKRGRTLARVHPDVANAFLQDQDDSRIRELRNRLSVQKAMHEDAQHKVTIKELVRQQDLLRQRQEELRRASTVVECQKALKSWETKDLGQGHPNGGTKEHCRNRLNVLDRIRARCKPLPPDLQNDWQWFIRNWDATMLRNMRADQRNAWGSEFLKIMQGLLDRSRDDGDALAKWMRTERASWLGLPALRV